MRRFRPAAGRDLNEAATPPEPPSPTEALLLGGLLAVSLIGTCVLLAVHAVHAVKLYRWLRRRERRTPCWPNPAPRSHRAWRSAAWCEAASWIRERRHCSGRGVNRWWWCRANSLTNSARSNSAALSPTSWPTLCGATIGRTVRVPCQGAAVVEPRGVVGRSRASRGARALLRRHRHRLLQGQSPRLCCNTAESPGLHPSGAVGALRAGDGDGIQRVDPKEI